MKKRLLFSCLLAMMAVMALNAQVYLCGAVNGWNINDVWEFSQNSDGLYVLKVNFASGREFKLSTVRPSDSDGQAWNQFDSGVLGVYDSPQLNEWTTLVPGVTNNINAPGSDEYTLYVDLADKKIMISDGGEGPTPAGAWSGTLPVLFVNTTDNLPVDSKEVYRKGTYYLDPMGVEGIEAIGTADQPLPLHIRGRGNYTWIGFDKKPYRLKLDAKAPLMGMKKSKHFALLAHADDNLGFMRNVFGFSLSRKFGLPWTPATQPLEVVLNGQYIGLYWLTETIRVDSDRVNVIEQEDLATTDVDGGWLVEIDNYDTDPHVTVITTGDYPVWFTYKSPEELSTEQETYLQSQMTAINTAVMAGDYNAFSDLVDPDCLARYFMVQQLMQDRESFHGSCYLNRQRGQASRWMFGPVWDFGNAFEDGTGDNPTFIGPSQFYQVWINEIYEMPEFQTVVKSVWQGLDLTWCDDIIRENRAVAESIVDAAKADARRWPQYGQTDIMNKFNTISSYLRNSQDWCTLNWGKVGIADATIPDAPTAVRYYNLQGTQIAAPLPGQPVIRICAGKADKIVIR